MAANVLQLTEGGFYKRLVCSRFLLGAVMLVRWKVCKAVLFY